jgi:hypothetical protein
MKPVRIFEPDRLIALTGRSRAEVVMITLVGFLSVGQGLNAKCQKAIRLLVSMSFPRGSSQRPAGEEHGEE